VTMRYGPEHKKETRARVLQQAARAIRADGPHRIGVAEVMARAGLTHGGFYAHFASKDDLVAAAIAQMFEEARALLERVTADKPPTEALRAYINLYLSLRHRDANETGCPMAALSADLPRLTAAARRQFAAGFGALAVAFSKLISAAGLPDAETLAPSVFAEMVGALTLARGTAGSKQSKAILETSRRSIASRLGLFEGNQNA
jgi:TetR/AcrR family transcriptional regulator, transcriptional repressor for nem operon